MPSLAASGTHTRVYTVNGPSPSDANTKGPDWLGTTLTRSYNERSKGKRGESQAKKNRRRQGLGTEGRTLIQDFDFPEASNCIRSTPDGTHLLATGTYKPCLKTWTLSDLSLKFSRSIDSESLTFICLSTDWTRSIHLLADRSLAVHTQSGQLDRVRLPTHGRALGYHPSSCDALVGGAGSDVWRFNLSQGRYLNPFTLDERVQGVDSLDVNPAHGLLSFGTDAGTVELWDPRARERAALLPLPSSSSSDDTSVTALASRSDGLNLAVGTSTGLVHLYDLRSSRPYLTKDQGYSLPLKSLSWLSPPSSSTVAEQGLIASMDSKIIKIFSRHVSPSTPEEPANVVAIEPASAPLNDLHIIPSTGLLLVANDHPSLSAFFVPSLGPAPSWCRYLDNLVAEEDPSSTTNPNSLGAYSDYKFLTDEELATLGLDHLIGTDTLRPYMHGHFVDVRLYAKAKAVKEPFEWRERRDRLAREKLEREQAGRIRKTVASSGGGGKKVGVRVNKDLARRLLDPPTTKSKGKQAEPDGTGKGGEGLLEDKRFRALFEDEEYEIDTTSREFEVVNPSLAARLNAEGARLGGVSEDDEGAEDEEEEAEEEEAEEEEDGDSDEEEDARFVESVKRPPVRGSRLVDPSHDLPSTASQTFARRLVPSPTLHSSDSNPRPGQDPEAEAARKLPGGGMEFTFVPRVPSEGDVAAKREKKQAAMMKRKEEKESVGFGLSRGNGAFDGAAGRDGVGALGKGEREGRQKRRRVERSASKKRMRAFK